MQTFKRAGMATRMAQRLASAGVVTLLQAFAMSDADLLALPNCGYRVLNRVRDIQRKHHAVDVLRRAAEH